MAKGRKHEETDSQHFSDDFEKVMRWINGRRERISVKIRACAVVTGMAVPAFILNETELDDGYSLCQSAGPAVNRVVFWGCRSGADGDD
jgi:hypothetical protein